MNNRLVSDLVEAVADSKGADPTDLEFALSEYIDVEAIQRLARNSDSEWRLSFELPQRRVYVASGGEILVERHGDPSPTPEVASRQD